MESSKSSKNSFGQTRKTMLFNERTDRSLNAELSQLDRSRKKVKRDLKKIHQVKDLLNTHLLSAMDLKSRHRSRSDTNVHDLSSGKLLPRITENSKFDPSTRRPRFNSDSVTLRRHSHVVYNDKITETSSTRPDKVAEKNVLSEKVSEVRDNFGPEQMVLAGENWWERDLERPLSRVYKTNQERREDLMIKSRFNQLGSKFVGKEMIEKRQKMLSRVQARDLQGIRNHQSRDTEKTETEQVPKKTAEDIDTKEKVLTEISSDFGVMAVTSPKTHENNLSVPVFSQPEGPYWQTRFQVCKIDPSKDTQPPKPQRKISSSSALGDNTVKRKISSSSMSGLDFDTSRPRNEVTLPRIPMELTSNRQTHNCLEHAFITCQQVDSDDKVSKKERKRRFANLVNAVIKQGKVINAWEPLLNKVGDIHSSDEETDSK